MNCLERLFGRMMGADEKIFKHGVFFRILNAVRDSSRVSKNGTGLYLLEFVSKLNLSLPFQNELKGREVLVLWFVRVLGKGFSVNQKFRRQRSQPTLTTCRSSSVPVGIPKRFAWHRLLAWRNDFLWVP